MDGVQIFRSGNMCDTPCGLAAQILALSWRSPTLIELLEVAERTLLCGIVGCDRYGVVANAAATVMDSG